VVAVLLVAIAAALAWHRFTPATEIATTKFGGPFTLVDQTGKTVTEKDLKGSPTLLFFGYTHCPDVCPATLSDLTLAMRQIGADAKKVKVVFVSIDPERDTQPVMAEYATAFDPDFRLLTGTRDEVDRIVKEYHVYAEKVPGEDGDYTMNHTAAVYMLNADGEFTGTMSYQEDMANMVKKIERLIAAS
jgi:protein SCO1/2